VAHAFSAGESRMTLLAYGTRDPSDIAFYARSNKVYVRAVGLIARLEPLDYRDGEDLRLYRARRPPGPPTSSPRLTR
jgi:uncharacterized cupin superfamily protein